MLIQNDFLSSLKNYTSDEGLHQRLWNEIESNYSQADRYYHNLSHLNALILELATIKNHFENWDALVFAIAYHDIVYNTMKFDNEEKSAELATLRLSAISFPKSGLDVCNRFILATKKHQPADRETNLFTDADLSILGADVATYQEYAQNIRKEYSIYPDILYNPGRKKVLQHFLSMESIYKTKEFFDKYEASARVNLQNELNRLL